MSAYRDSQITRPKASVTTASTDTALAAAVAGKVLRVVSLVLSCGATATAVTINSKPAGAGTAISATFTLGINGVLVLPENAYGWFQSTAGEGLTVTTGAGSTVAVQAVVAEL